jgi:hypothetical protein
LSDIQMCLVFGRSLYSKTVLFQDYPVGNGTGVYQSKRLFTTKQNHAAVLQLDVLIKDEDFNTESPRGKAVVATDHGYYRYGNSSGRVSHLF